MGLPTSWLRSGLSAENASVPTNSSRQGRTHPMFEEHSAILHAPTPANRSTEQGRTRSIFEEHSAILHAPVLVEANDGELDGSNDHRAEADQFLENLGEELEHLTTPFPPPENVPLGPRLEDMLNEEKIGNADRWAAQVELHTLMAEAEVLTRRIDDLMAEVGWVPGTATGTLTTRMGLLTEPVPWAEVAAHDPLVNFGTEVEFPVHTHIEMDLEGIGSNVSPEPDGHALTDEEELTRLLFGHHHAQHAYGPDFWAHARNTWLGPLWELELFIGRILQINQGLTARRIWDHLDSRRFFFYLGIKGEQNVAIDQFVATWEASDQAGDSLWSGIADTYADTDLGRLISNDFLEFE